MHAGSMRFELTEPFRADFKRLTPEHQVLFREVVSKFHDAAEAIASGRSNRWPAGLRVKSVQGAPGVFELTWSFSGPDGRATWEWATIDGPSGPERGVRWRRLGGHGIFRDP